MESESILLFMAESESEPESIFGGAGLYLIIFAEVGVGAEVYSF